MQREGYELTERFEARHWWFRSRRDLFLRQVALAARSLGTPRQRLRLLDFGCGTGYNLRFLSDFGDVFGADRADEALGEFRREPEFPRLDLRSDLHAYHGSFDIVTALDVLEHIDDDVVALREIMAFLRPRGQLIVTVPAYRWLWSGEDAISQHKRRYTRSTLARCCERAGGEIEFLSYFNGLILPAAAAVIWGERLFARARTPKSNVRESPSWLNELLYRLAGLEARMVGGETLRMPAGASLICRLGFPSPPVES